MVHSSVFDMADPLAHGGILLDLPFDADFAPLADDELGLLSAPTSPESLLDEPLSGDLFSGSMARPAYDAKADAAAAAAAAMHWSAIMSGVPEVPTVPVAKLRGAAADTGAFGVMWNVPPTAAAVQQAPPPLHAVFGGASPVPSDSDLDFHSFLADELSSDDEILIADGEVLKAAVAAAGHKRRRTAAPALPAAAAQQQQQQQAKKAKLAALRQLPPHIAADTPEGKRHTHNVLERKRREDLKISYQNLRLTLPELAAVERAPTGQILVKAAEYIAELKDEDERIMQQLRALRVQNASLQRACRGASA